MKKFKRKWKESLKRASAIALAVLMVGNTIDMSAFVVSAAEETQTVLCEHHTDHTAECGYSEGTGEIPCTHECSEESGCVIVTENCTHTEHDETCGYQEAVEGTSCTYVCELCADENKEELQEEQTETCICTEKCTEESTNAECPVCNAEGADVNVCMGTTELIPECTCDTDDPAFHATNCTAYVAPENPECYCVEKCTEDNINVWCDVCGVQGIEACGGEEKAAVYEASSVPVLDKITDPNYPMIFANGTPIYIDWAEDRGSDTYGLAVVYYYDKNNTLQYVNESGADGDNLIKCTIYGGCLNEVLEGNTSITMYGGAVYGIYGGGRVYENNYAAVSVEGNSTVTVISDESSGTKKGVYIESSIGGGMVTGNATVKIQSADNVEKGGVYVQNTIYGGRSTESGTVTVELTSNNRLTVGPASVYGGRGGNAIVNVGENVEVTGNVFGANGTMSGDTLVTISGTVAKNVYGGGDTGTVTGSTKVILADGSKVGECYTRNNGNGFLPEYNYCVYGGGRAGNVQGSTEVQVGVMGSDIKCPAAIYGGGYTGVVSGDTKVMVAQGATLGRSADTNDDYFTNVYGGGYTGTVGGSTTVEIGGTIFGNVHGGSYGNTTDTAKGKVTGNTSVTIKEGGSVYYVYGGGQYSDVGGSTSVDTAKDSTVKGSLYSGSVSGTVGGKATVTIKGTVQLGIMNEGEVTGGTNVTIDGGTVGSSSTNAKILLTAVSGDGITLKNSGTLYLYTHTSYSKITAQNGYGIKVEGGTLCLATGGERKAINGTTADLYVENDTMPITVGSGDLLDSSCGKYTVDMGTPGKFAVPGDSVTITLDEFTAADSTNYTVEKVGSNLWLKGEIASVSVNGSYIYTGSPVDLELTVKDKAGADVPRESYTLKYKVQNADDSTYSTDAPTSAGSYTVKVTAKSNSAYQGEATTDFEISKADIVISAVPTAIADLVYTGSTLPLVTEGTTSHGTMHYALGTNNTTAPTDGWVATIPTATNAGTYYIWYKVVSDTNYVDIAAQCVEVTIAPKEVTAIWLGEDFASKYPYTGVEIKPEVKVLYDDDTGALIPTDQYTVVYSSNPEPINVGEYCIGFKGVEGGNYTFYSSLESGAFMYSIVRTKPVITWSNASYTKEYIGNSANIVATIDMQSNASAGAITYSCTGIVNGQTVNCDGLPTDTGSYTVTASYAGDDNHEAASAETSLTITQATLKVASVEAMGRVYDGTKTVTISKVILEGIFGSDDVSVQTTGLTGALSSANADTYTSVTLPELSLTGAAAGNYTLEQPLGAVTTSVIIAKKEAPTVDEINEKYLYSKETADSINIAELLPTDCGTVAYGTPTTTGAVTYNTNPVVADGVLSYTVASGDIDATGSITVVAETQNYENITITVNVKLTDQMQVSLQEGSSVILKNNAITYGEALSKLIFDTAVFVDQDGNTVTGVLAWKDSTIKPNAGTTSATWVFTPTDEVYLPKDGTVEIAVNQATPNVSVLPMVADRVYDSCVALADKDITGGSVIGVDGEALAGAWSWLTAGIVSVVENNGYVAVFTPEDTTNYKTVQKTLSVKVEPRALHVIGATAEDKSYDGTNVVKITDVILNGVLTGDEVFVNVENLSGTVSGKAPGGYEAVTLPALQLSGAKAGNYTLIQPAEPVTTQVTISKAKAVITAKYDVYNKIYNDDAFSIADDITTVGEGILVYSVSNGLDADGQPKVAEDIVTVSQDGLVTVLGSGSVTLTLSMAETVNYEAAEPKNITIQITAWDDVPRNGFFVKSMNVETYTGKAIKPEPEVWDGNGEVRLEKGKDYTISYKNNKNAYTLKEGEEGFNAKKAPTMIIKGKGNYDQKLTVYFTIQPKDIADLSDAGIEVDDMVFEANGKSQKKTPVIKVNGKKLGKKDFTVTYPASEDAALAAVAYKEPGIYPIVITGKGNYTGSRTVNLIVAAKGTSLAKATIGKIPTQEFDGVNAVELDDIELVVTAKVNGKKETLKRDVHYTVEYTNNKAVGTATVTVKAIEGSGFAGFKKATFKVTGTSIVKAKVEGVENQIYTGSAQKLALKVTVSVKDAETGVAKDVVLTEGTDYKVTYSKNTNVGTATVIISGIGKFTGTIKKTFKITAVNMVDVVAVKDGELTAKYVKGGAKPFLNLVFNGRELKEGKDYTVTYKNNKVVYTAKAGENGFDAKKAPTITIKGKGNFAGSVSRTFVITGRSLTDVDVAVTMSVADKAVSTKKGGYISKVVITDTDGKVLKQGTDYSAPVYTMVNEKGETVTLTKGDTAPVGSVITVSVTGLGVYEDAEGRALTAIYRITDKDFTKVKVTGIQKKYTGKVVELTAADFMNEDGSSKVTFSSGKNATELVYGKDFEIVPGSYKNNVRKGTATVTIKGCGEYGGTKTVKFSIGARSLWFWWL